MAIGFSERQNFDPIIGWILNRVIIEEHNVVFGFDDGRGLINVAYKLSYVSSDKSVSYEYDLERGTVFCVPRVIGKKIVSCSVLSKSELQIRFENGDQLSIFDNPEFRSWWIWGQMQETVHPSSGTVIATDFELDELSPFQVRWRQT